MYKRQAEVLLELGEIEAADAEIARIAEGRRSAGEIPTWLAIRPLELRAQRAIMTGDVEAQVELTRAVFDGWSIHRSAGEEILETARTNHSNTLLFMGRYQEAYDLLEEGVTAMGETDLAGGAHQATQKVNLASALLGLGEIERAKTISSEVIEVARDMWGPSNPKTIAALSTHANILGQLGRREESCAIFEEIAGITVEAFGIEHTESLNAVNNHAVALLYIDDAERALEVIEPCVAVVKEGIANPVQAVHVQTTYAGALQSVGRVAEALPACESLVAQLEELTGPAHPQTLISRNNLMTMLLESDRAAESIALGRRNIELATASDPSMRWIQFPFRSNLARALAQAGKFEEAEAELLAVDAFLASDTNTVDSETTRIAELLVDTYESWGKPGAADQWRERAKE